MLAAEWVSVARTWFYGKETLHRHMRVTEKLESLEGRGPPSVK